MAPAVMQAPIKYGSSDIHEKKSGDLLVMMDEGNVNPFGEKFMDIGLNEFIFIIVALKIVVNKGAE